MTWQIRCFVQFFLIWGVIILPPHDTIPLDPTVSLFMRTLEKKEMIRYCNRKQEKKHNSNQKNNEEKCIDALFCVLLLVTRSTHLYTYTGLFCTGGVMNRSQAFHKEYPMLTARMRRENIRRVDRIMWHATNS